MGERDVLFNPQTRFTYLGWARGSNTMPGDGPYKVN